MPDYGGPKGFQGKSESGKGSGDSAREERIRKNIVKVKPKEVKAVTPKRRSRPPIVKKKFVDVDAEKALMAKESAIQESQTKGLQEVGKQRRGKLLGILADPTTSKDDKLNRIWEQNLLGSFLILHP